MQDKYINQIFDLFQDFHIVLVPQLTDEVRGAESIRSFSQFLVEEYDPEQHGGMLEVESSVCNKYVTNERNIQSTHLRVA